MWTLRIQHMLFGGTASLAVVLAAVAPTTAQNRTSPRGRTRRTGDLDGRGPMEGVVVTAKRHDSTIAVSVVSDGDGRYRFPADRLQAGPHALSIRAVGYELKGPLAVTLGRQERRRSICPSPGPGMSKRS